VNDWRAAAACAGRDAYLWFVSPSVDPTGAAVAAHICATCPVRHECAGEAIVLMRHGPLYGTWAGVSIEAATGMAATITYPGTAPAYQNLPDAFIDAAASVNKHRKMPATLVLVSIGAWAFLVKQKDTAGRPLVTTGRAGNPMNAYGQAGAAQVLTGAAGEVVGLAVVPSWAGVDNHIYVLKADDCLLLESSVFNFRYEEVLGPSAIRLGVWGYAAPVIARYPTAIAKIDAGTTIPAPAEMDAETPAAVGPGTGEGPGTPPRRR
jgi:hypothetical protein